MSFDHAIQKEFDAACDNPIVVILPARLLDFCELLLGDARRIDAVGEIETHGELAFIPQLPQQFRVGYISSALIDSAHHVDTNDAQLVRMFQSGPKSFEFRLAARIGNGAPD